MLVSGDRVVVLYGRYQGRVGRFLHWHVNPGRPGGQQGQLYPVVRLDSDLGPTGRTRAARTVRVLAVEREPRYQANPYPDIAADGRCHCHPPYVDTRAPHAIGARRGCLSVGALLSGS